MNSGRVCDGISDDLCLGLYFSLFPDFLLEAHTAFITPSSIRSKSWSLLSLTRLSWSHVSSLPQACTAPATLAMSFFTRKERAIL